MVDETNNDRKNIQQQQLSTQKESNMEEEIDQSTSNKQKQQEQKNLIRRTSGGQQQQQKKQKEDSLPSRNNTTTIQKEIKDLPKVTLSKTIKTPSKDLTDQDLDKSLDDPAIIHEAQQIFSRIAEKVDPKNINELMKKSAKEKKLPDDSTNLIISQQIEFGKLWTSRLVQMISIDEKLIQEIYKNTGINNRNIEKKIKYALYISAPILYIIRLHIQEMQKKMKRRTKSLYAHMQQPLSFP